MRFNRNITRNVAASTLIFATVMSSWSACANAQENMMQRLAERFQAADTNHDGHLTRDEAMAGMPRVAQHFDQIDTSRTGSITLQQIVAFANSQRGS
jgi:Ca2+-binding EF-hand superfamily protein